MYRFTSVFVHNILPRLFILLYGAFQSSFKFDYIIILCGVVDASNDVSNNDIIIIIIKAPHCDANKFNEAEIEVLIEYLYTS